MGVKLPLLPFRNKEEKILFAQLVLGDSLPQDDEQAAIEWCKYADGVNIMFKLPYFIFASNVKNLFKIQAIKV